MKANNERARIKMGYLIPPGVEAEDLLQNKAGQNR